MKQKRRTPALHHMPAIGLILVGLMFVLGGLLPAGQAALARAATGRELAWNAAQGLSPDWLAMVETPNELYSQYPLARLAGRLILFGALSAPGCENGGLYPSGEATECGLQVAQPALNEWQNQFNGALVTAGQQAGVPPRLLKNIFAWESQFWPETIFVNTYEFGLGHMTLMGADSALRWNPELYQAVCATSYAAETCTQAYPDQPSSLRSGLQGALVQRVKADCPTCRFNLDLQRAEASIAVFAQTVQANHSYVRYALRAITGLPAAEKASPEDIWRFTLVSYNAGPGCFRSALQSVYYRGLPIDWANLQKYLEPACRGSIPYVAFVSSTDAYHPENDPSLHAPAEPDPQPTPAAPPEPVWSGAAHSDRELLVQIAPERWAQAMQALQALEIAPEQVSPPLDPFGTRLIALAPGTLEAALAALQTSAEFASVEPNYWVNLAGLPDDPRFTGGEQASLNAIQVANLNLPGAPALWDSLDLPNSPAGAEVLVAVLDTGIDLHHPDLSGQLWHNPGEVPGNGLDDDGNGWVDDVHGWNFVAGSPAVDDDHQPGHGTQAAGVIAAGFNNGLGMAGIAPNARLMAVKVLDHTGQGSHAQVAQGILYATQQGAQVIHMGFGGVGSSTVLENAVQYALSRGVLLVAAAGNQGLALVHYPAGYGGVLAVSAVDNFGAIDTNSNRGTHISLAAPGVNILSTQAGIEGAAGGYGLSSGTSMAAAHVSGTAALLAGQPAFSGPLDHLRSALLATALDAGALGPDPLYGAGILQADAALHYTGSGPGGVPPAVLISAPAKDEVFPPGVPVQLAASVEGASAGSLLWSSDIDGALGSGASLQAPRLTPGLHRISASAASLAGQGTASVTIRVLADAGPHGGFQPDTSACAACHGAHQDGATASAVYSNSYCLSCHDGSQARRVSTHGNQSASPAVQALRQEASFGLLCIQCHNPHGGQGNHFALRAYPRLGALPFHWSAMTPLATPLVFDRLPGEDGSAAQLEALCLACHENPANPGYPMAHPGGAGHSAGAVDTTGQSCLACHRHETDGDPLTADGFMPSAGPPVIGAGNPTPMPTPAR